VGTWPSRPRPPQGPRSVLCQPWRLLRELPRCLCARYLAESPQGDLARPSPRVPHPANGTVTSSDPCPQVTAPLAYHRRAPPDPHRPRSAHLPPPVGGAWTRGSWTRGSWTRGSWLPPGQQTIPKLALLEARTPTPRQRVVRGT
jgi:hypothetical protein